MAYTFDQLTAAYKAVHDGISADAATQANLQVVATLSANGQLTDAQVLSNILNGADSSTALAVLSYQFFTGKGPTAAGLTYLVNSTVNTADLNDAYYAKFSLENRYINFAANLGIAGEGATAFAAKYAALGYVDFVSSIYETIVGSSYASATGLDPKAAMADIVSRKDAILATATSAGMINANMTAAQADLALKAATAGYVLAEAIKADVGLYAAAANNFMLGLATGSAVYNSDITRTYLPTVDSGSHGTGHAVDRGPLLPSGTTAPPTSDPAAAPSHAFVLTAGADTFTGEGSSDTFTGTNLTFNATDVLNGAGGADSLIVTMATGATYVAPAAASLTGIETVGISNNADVTVNASAWTGLTKLNIATPGAATLTGPVAAISIDGYAAASITDSQLTSLTLSNGGGNVTIVNSGLPLPAATTLNLALNGVSGGTLTDANVYTTLNITTGAAASTLAGVTDSALTTLTVSGASGLTLTSTAGAPNLHTVTVTGSAGLTANFIGSAVTSINTVGGTGFNNIAYDASAASYTGGAGSDLVQLSSGTISQAITLGGGTDFVVFHVGTGVPGATVDGGTGLDGISMDAGDAATVSASPAWAAKVINFELLQLLNPSNHTINVGNLGFHSISTNLGNGLTLNNMSSGDTIELDFSGVQYTIGAGNFGGASDSLNLRLSDTGGSSYAYATAGFLTSGVETINIATINGSATPATESFVLSGTDVTTLNVSGNAGLDITAASTAIATVNAGSLTVDGLHLQLTAPVGALTVTGSATAANSVVVPGAYAGALNYTGGAAADTISVGGGANDIKVGASAAVDTVNILGVNAASNSVFTTVTGLGAGDVINVSAFNTATVGAIGAQVTGPSTFAGFLDAAAAGAANTLHWFVFGGATYIVADNSASATFTAGTDLVVKLAGVVDLSAAAAAGGILTLH
jgi:S-layer protein